MAESIAAVTTRSLGSATRLPAAISLREDSAEAAALHRAVAPVRGEGTRSEDHALRQRERAASGVTYPPPGPSLPPPLVPIREIPYPDVQRLYEEPLETQQIGPERLAEAALAPAPETPAPRAPGEDDAEEAARSRFESGPRPAAAEPALDRIVFAQAAQPRSVAGVDSALAGQLFDIEA